MMKICQATHLFLPNYIGGIPNYVFKLSQALGEQGLDVEIYTGDNVKTRSFDFIDQKVRVIRLPMRTLPLTWGRSDMAVNLRIIPQMLLALMKCDADLIHTHDLFQVSSHMAALASRLSNKPLVMTMHSRYDFYKFTRTLAVLKKIHDYSFGKYTLKQVKKIIFVSKSAAEDALQMGIESSKVEVIYPAINIGEFNTILNDTGCEINFYSQKVGLGDYKHDYKIILAVGRIEKRKGFQYLIRAVPALIAKEPKIKVVIAGPDAGYAEELKKLVANLGIDRFVIFTGGLSDTELNKAFLGASTFVLPSEHDNFPEVALRAAYIGSPIVASNTGGIPEFVEDGQNGLLVEVGNAEQLAQAIISLLNDRELANKLSQRARQDVIEKYTLSQMANKIIKVYEEVLAEAKR